MNNRFILNDIVPTIKGFATRTLKRNLGPFKKRHNWLTQTQWLSPDALQELQLKLLRRTIKHAYETVPYYTALMDDRGIKPDDVRSLSDIELFPVMNKSDAINAGEDLFSTKFNRSFLKTAHTGGTTGLPVPVKRDLHSIGNEHAFVRRQFDWAGVSISDRCAYLEGRNVAPLGKKPDKIHYYDAAMRELSLSTFHLSFDLVPRYVELIKAYKIKTLVAYPSAAFILAKACLEMDLSLKLDSVLTTSETIDEIKKKVISEAFECPVYDFYGSAERVVYIHTCEKGSYHVIPEYGYTELIPADPPNEDSCRVISTGFWNQAMPLIRYDMGDLVRPSDQNCSCGRNFPVVESILGRDGNVIRTPNGTVLGASAIECILGKVLYSMYNMPVEAGRVIQESSDLIVLEYVPMKQFGSEDKSKLRKVMRDYIPGDMGTDIRKVDNIGRTTRGKLLSFVMAEHH